MRNKTPVVVVRKAKKINPITHGLAFMLTGGTSGIYTAAKAASNAGYNARTRQLQAEAEGPEDYGPGVTVTKHGRIKRRKARDMFTDEELAYMKAHTARHGS